MTKPNQAIQGFDSRRLQRIDDVIARNYIETGAIPGALTMVWRRGELVWRSASGVAGSGAGLAASGRFHLPPLFHDQAGHRGGAA